MEKLRQVLLTVLMVVVMTGSVWFQRAHAGDLDAPAGPTSAGSAMYTLEDVYNRLDAGTEGTKRAGEFSEPSSGPASTGHTLDEVYAKAIPTQVGKTGQKDCYYDNKSGTCTCGEANCPSGQDGGLEKGVAWPAVRFSDNGDGTVTDNLTGLIWLQNANCPNATRDLASAFSDVVQLNTIGRMNDNHCGDRSAGGTHQTDWRLPNIRELQSLVSYEFAYPSVSADNGTDKWDTGSGTSSFSDVKSLYYWSSTTHAFSTSYAWAVYMDFGRVTHLVKTTKCYVWPVRGGQ